MTDYGHDLSRSIPTDAMYVGELSFARRRTTRDLDGVDIAVVGIPFDLGTTNRPGARLGPRAIREQSSQVAAYPWGLWPWDFNVFERCEVIDYSDIASSPGYADRMIDAVTSEVGSILDAGVSVVSLGGDHMVAFPLLRAHHARHGPLSLVHFDAHSDTWSDGDDLNHGTVFHLAVRDGLVDPAHSVQVGLRTPNPDDHGFTIVDAEQLRVQGTDAVIAMIREVVGARPAYLTLDMDFLDPAYAPGTGTPVIGGPTTAEARSLLHGLAGMRIVGGDVVEVSPPYDGAGQITALAAATLAHDLLHLVALGRDSGRAE